jgi:TPR repeat protein
MKDGDAAVDTGYCYQYGIGVRRDSAKAKSLYRAAVKSRNITEYGREAAMYHLALQLVDEQKSTLAVPLLERASSNGDFPEAAAALRALQRGTKFKPCRCRRFIKKNLLGHAKCPMHT